MTTKKGNAGMRGVSKEGEGGGEEEGNVIFEGRTNKERLSYSANRGWNGEMNKKMCSNQTRCLTGGS